MIKRFCDRCEHEIVDDTKEIVIDIKYYLKSKSYGSTQFSTERSYCVDCVEKLGMLSDDAISNIRGI